MSQRVVEPLCHCHGEGDSIIYHDLSGRFLIEVGINLPEVMEGTYEQAAERLIQRWRDHSGKLPAYLVHEDQTVQVFHAPMRIDAPATIAHREFLELKLADYRSRHWLLGEGMANRFKIMIGEAVLNRAPVDMMAIVNQLLANQDDRQHLLRWLKEFTQAVDVIAKYSRGDFSGLVKSGQPYRPPDVPPPTS